MLPRGSLRPVVLAIAALALVAPATTGCGEAVPRYQLHTAPEWVSMLWDPDVRVRTAALSALAQFGATAPDAVLAALEDAIETPPPAPTASPFSMAVDLTAGKRLGLPATPVTDAVAAAAGVLRGRAMAAGTTPMSMKALLDGTIDLVVSRPLPRADVEHLQAVFATRGATEFRLLVPDPAAAPVVVGSGGPTRRRVYDDAMPYADRIAAEAKEIVSAREAKRPPARGNSRWRAVPKTAAAESPADFVLVEEPASEADALDERMVVVAKAGRDADGRATVRIDVKPERREALARFAQANAGQSMAVVLDGVLLGVQRVPKTDGDVLVLSLWREGAEAAPVRVSAEDLAVVLAAGRLPWPLRPIPLDPSFGADPAPDNLLAKAFTLLEARAIPTLERIAAKAPHAWSRKSATWALEQIRAHADAPGR